MSTVQADAFAASRELSTPLHVEGAPRREQLWNAVLQDGQAVLLRQTGKRDTELQRRFIETLPSDSHRFRFLGTMTMPSEDLLRRHYDFDAGSDVVLIASIGEGGEQKAIGLGRFCTGAGRSCRFIVVVSEEWQQRGVGTLLMQHLICSAMDRGIRSMHALDSADDKSMCELAAQLGFDRTAAPDDASRLVHSLDLIRRRSKSNHFRA